MLASIEPSWFFGIHDPTLTGWLCVVAYLIALTASIALCRQLPHAYRQDVRAFWGAITLVLAMLGINKQLDIQTLMLQTIRKTEFWANNGTIYLEILVTFFALIGVGAFIVFFLRFRFSDWETCLVMIAIASLLGMLLLNLLPIRPINKLLMWHVFGKDQGFFNCHLKEFFEIGFISVVAICAGFFRRRLYLSGEKC
jgi:uncharacterized membrane protein